MADAPWPADRTAERPGMVFALYLFAVFALHWLRGQDTRLNERGSDFLSIAVVAILYKSDEAVGASHAVTDENTVATVGVGDEVARHELMLLFCHAQYTYTIDVKL